jgi:DNA-binding CsgD family transcriptional regulator
LQIGWNVDVREAAMKLRCPVLIVHPERDKVVPIEEGHILASLIPNCRFVQLDSENHMPLPNEPEWPRLLREIQKFLSEPSPAQNERRSLPLLGLTPRERAVLDCIASGLTNTQIASTLDMREKTVRNHITHLFGKIGVQNRSQAIVLAREAGLGRFQPAATI